jgi:hypothetical protein
MRGERPRQGAVRGESLDDDTCRSTVRRSRPDRAPGPGRHSPGIVSRDDRALAPPICAAVPRFSFGSPAGFGALMVPPAGAAHEVRGRW